MHQQDSRNGAMRAIATSVAVFALLGTPIAAWAQSVDTDRPLTVVSGRPLDVVLDERIVIKRVGQPITGRIVQPVYAYDRVVVPAGTVVNGRVAALEGPSRVTRIRAMLSGDLTPPRHVVLQFETLVLDGEQVPIQTAIKTEIPHITRSTAPAAAPETPASTGTGRLTGEAQRRAQAAIADARQRGRDVLAEITQPGRMARLKDALVQRLPYHPQVIAAGTGYHAELTAPLQFGTVTPVEAAPASANPAPSSLLSARLLTDLDSSKTPRGTRIQAAITEPVFSADRQLILPEGTLIEGDVTLARPARRLHRNGQLRFLFETVHRDTAAAPAPLLASLEAVETSSDDHVAIDDEGGASLKSPKTRFIAPALAVLALRGSFDHHQHLDPDGDGHMISSNHSGALGTGGFLGLGVLGIGLSQISRPVGLGLSVFGAARTLYANVLGKGREVQFPADTLIQLQLAPGTAENH